MNLFDLIVGVATVAALVLGFRSGLVRSAATILAMSAPRRLR